MASNTASIAGGGTYLLDLGGAPIYNCIIYDNLAPNGPNYLGTAPFTYCCSIPLSGSHDITKDPEFINPSQGNFRLQTNSPCINAGDNPYVFTSTDLDGRPRVVGGTVDLGAYEFQGPGIGEFTAWLQQYGLPTGGSADSTDSDGDGMNNYQEWVAGTNPTNAASALALLPLLAANNANGLTVTWQSVDTRTYYLLRATNLAGTPAFSAIQSNLLGQAGRTSFGDVTATNDGPYFYRVGVQ